MEKTDYIPISLIERIYPEVDSTKDEDLLCTIIKLNSGETWKTTFDITFSKRFAATIAVALVVR